MPLLTAGYEGQPNATAATAANSADNGDSPISSVTLSGTINYSNTIAANGSNKSLQYAGGNTAASYVVYNAGSASANFAVRIYAYLVAEYPSVESQFPIVMRTAANGHVCRLQMTTAGLIRMVNTAGSTIAISSVAVPTDAWLRFEYYVTGAGTSTATVNLDVYVGSSTTPLFSLSGTNVALTGGQVQSLVLGSNTAAASRVWYFDDIAFNVGSATPIGPVALPPDPWSYGFDVRIG